MRTNVTALAGLVVLPVDLETAGAIAGRVDVQDQGRLGDERRRKQIGRIVPDVHGDLGIASAVAIVAILIVPAFESVDAQARGLEPKRRTNVDIRAPVLIQDDLLASVIVVLPHLQQTAAFLASRSSYRQARLLVEPHLRSKILGLIPVESDRQVRAVDLSGLDRILVKLPSSETVRFRILDADGIGDGSVGIEVGQNPGAAGERDVVGIAGVVDIGLRRGSNAPGEVALQGNVLVTDD